MNKFINKIYIKALVGANMAKNELQKMREEDEGLDIIITIILVAVGLVLVGILVNYAKKIVSTADSQVNQIGNTVGGLNFTRTGFPHLPVPCRHRSAAHPWCP